MPAGNDIQRGRRNFVGYLPLPVDGIEGRSNVLEQRHADPRLSQNLKVVLRDGHAHWFGVYPSSTLMLLRHGYYLATIFSRNARFSPAKMS